MKSLAQQLTADPNIFRRLWRQLSQKRRRQLLLVYLLMLMGAVAEVLSLGAVLPFLTVIADPNGVLKNDLFQPVFKVVGLTSSSSLLIALMILFATAVSIAGLLRVALVWIGNKYVFALGHDLGTSLYSRVLNQPYAWHVSHNTSEVIANIQKVQVVTSGFMLPLMQALSAGLIGSCIAATLIIIDPFISAIAFLSFTALYVGVTISSKRRLKQNSATVAKFEGQRIQAVQEGLGGIRDVILDSSQSVFLQRFSRLDAAVRNAQATSTIIGTAPRYVIEAVGMVFIASLAIILSAGPGGFSYAMPALGAIALGAQRMLPLMQLVFLGWTRVAANWDTLDDVLTMLESPVNKHLVSTSPLSFTRSIAFQEVTFSYDGGDSILSNASFTIEKGTRIGVIGSSGSGKSTLADLLMGLLEPTSGTISIDGVTLDACNKTAWQRQIAHVPQSIFLADASLAENIAFGIEKKEIDYSRVVEMAKLAELHAVVDRLPLKYETLVGEGGMKLSGGQRQRIGIARALYKKAALLVLDEATSALDEETEAVVMTAVTKLSSTLTVVIITHRLDTLSDCDYVLLITPEGVIKRRANFSRDNVSPIHHS